MILINVSDRNSEYYVLCIKNALDMVETLEQLESFVDKIEPVINGYILDDKFVEAIISKVKTLIPDFENDHFQALENVRKDSDLRGILVLEILKGISEIELMGLLFSKEFKCYGNLKKVIFDDLWNKLKKTEDCVEVLASSVAINSNIMSSIGPKIVSEIEKRAKKFKNLKDLYLIIRRIAEFFEPCYFLELYEKMRQKAEKFEDWSFLLEYDGNINDLCISKMKQLASTKPHYFSLWCNALKFKLEFKDAVLEKYVEMMTDINELNPFSSYLSENRNEGHKILFFVFEKFVKKEPTEKNLKEIMEYTNEYPDVRSEILDFILKQK